MSKPQLQLRVPRNMREEVREFEEEHGIENTSEAARQVLRRGLDHEDTTPAAGERLAETATGVAGVGAIVAVVAAPAFAVPFGGVAFVFALLWASVRALNGRDLV
jgi:hypothetical protein